MRQDPDLQRQLLMKIEDCENLMGLGFVNKEMARVAWVPEEDLKSYEDLTKEVEYNLGLLAEQGQIRIEKVGQYPHYNLTTLGHASVDAIRDSGFWSKLKDVTPKEAALLIRETLTANTAHAVTKMLGLD